MKRLIKKVTAVMLVLAMVMGLSVTVMADEGTTSTQPTLSITKELKVPVGVTVPNVAFKFNVKQNLGDDVNYGPYIEMLNLSFDSNDVDVDNSGSIVKSTPDILDQEGISFPHAGLYSFVVTEHQTLYSGGLGEGESMDFSGAQYEVFITVKNVSPEDDNDGEDDGLVIDRVVVEKQEDDNGNEIEEGVTGGTKVTSEVPGDITGDGEGSGENPGEGTTPGEGSGSTATESAGNGFRFVNVYEKKAGSYNEELDKYESLKIDNTVTGAYANQEYDFEYKLTLNIPNVAADATFGTSIGRSILSGVEFPFTLSHGKELVLYDLPAGTTYTLKQTGVADYTTSAMLNGTEEITTAGMGEDFVIPVTIINDDAAMDTAAVTNAYNDSAATPTGIIINNLPYVIMVLIAVLGICMIMVSKRRRA